MHMSKWLHKAESRANTVGELMVFLWENRLWWVIPFVIMLLLVGILVVFAQTSPVAPFMYALF